MFQDRSEAGRQLARALLDLHGKDVLVLGVPRGGVIVAYEVAVALDAPLDVYIARKLGAPGNDELALGAVASDGTVVLDSTLIRQMGVTQRYLHGEMERQRAEILRRLSVYRSPNYALPPLKGKTVILVDDGVATGSTTTAVLRALRKQSPGLLVLGVPVGPADAIAHLRAEADRVICLATAEPSMALASAYANWEPLGDQEVVDVLLKRRAQVEASKQKA